MFRALCSLDGGAEMSDTDNNRVDEFVQELMPWLGSAATDTDTSDDYHCFRCGRVLQQSSMAEITGLCDHCRETVVLERTALANLEYRATNEYGEMLRNRMDKATQPKAKRTLRERLVSMLASTSACDWEDCG